MNNLELDLVRMSVSLNDSDKGDEAELVLNNVDGKYDFLVDDTTFYGNKSFTLSSSILVNGVYNQVKLFSGFVQTGSVSYSPNNKETVTIKLFSRWSGVSDFKIPVMEYRNTTAKAMFFDLIRSYVDEDVVVRWRAPFNPTIRYYVWKNVGVREALEKIAQSVNCDLFWDSDGVIWVRKWNHENNASVPTYNNARVLSEKHGWGKTSLATYSACEVIGRSLFPDELEDSVSEVLLGGSIVDPAQTMVNVDPTDTIGVNIGAAVGDFLGLSGNKYVLSFVPVFVPKGSQITRVSINERQYKLSDYDAAEWLKGFVMYRSQVEGEFEQIVVGLYVPGGLRQVEYPALSEIDPRGAYFIEGGAIQSYQNDNGEWWQNRPQTVSVSLYGYIPNKTERVVKAKYIDESLVSRFGAEKWLTIENDLIQTVNIAKEISLSRLAHYRDLRDSIDVEVPHNPCLERGDRIRLVNTETGLDVEAVVVGINHNLDFENVTFTTSLNCIIKV